MMVVVFIHNPFDSQCNNLLAQIRGRYPRLEVYDFQALRGLRWVQGAPSVWIFRDDQNPLTDEPIWRQDISVNLNDVDAAVASLQAQA